VKTIYIGLVLEMINFESLIFRKKPRKIYKAFILFFGVPDSMKLDKYNHIGIRNKTIPKALCDITHTVHQDIRKYFINL
jgi:hypothetical protein